MQKIDLKGKAILVTGGAGFIGSNLIKRLLTDAPGSTIVSIDNMNDYYDVALKEYRLRELQNLTLGTGPFVRFSSDLTKGPVPTVRFWAQSEKMWANLWLVTMMCSSISGMRSISASIRPRIVESPIFSRGLGKFFVNSPRRVAYPAAMTIFFI